MLRKFAAGTSDRHQGDFIAGRDTATFPPGLKTGLSCAPEEMLLSSLGHCLESNLMQFKNKHTVEYLNVVKQAVHDCKRNYVSIYESGLHCIMHILSHGMTV